MLCCTISRNSENYPDDSIAVLLMSVVFISCTKNSVDICNSANDNHRLGGTQMYSMALGCIPRVWASFEGSRLHSKALDSIRRHWAAFQRIQLYSNALGNISRDSTLTQINWAWRVHMSQQIGKEDWGLGLQSSPNHQLKQRLRGRFPSIVLCILIIKTTTFTYEIKHLNLLTKILLLSISSNTIFSHTLYEKCSEL
jgi:hypothetical protein